MEAIVTARTMIPPPISALAPGASPIAKKTHMGLNTGSMTAMRIAETAEIRLIAKEKRIDDIPI